MRIFGDSRRRSTTCALETCNDSVWTAIQTQQHEQAKQKAAAQQKKTKAALNVLVSAVCLCHYPHPKCQCQLLNQSSYPYKKLPPPHSQMPTLTSTHKQKCRTLHNSCHPQRKVANVAKQVSDVDDNGAANTSTSAHPTQSQRVPTLPTNNALLAQRSVLRRSNVRK